MSKAETYYQAHNVPILQLQLRAQCEDLTIGLFSQVAGHQQERMEQDDCEIAHNAL